MKYTAIVLAGGRGSRMKSDVPKQYLLLDGRPVLYYALSAFQECSRIDEIILVCSRDEIEKCRKEIVDRYELTKVAAVVAGGKERYHSVYEGLKAAEGCDYVLIHDGARPFVDQALLERILDELPVCQACVAAVPVKDTIKRGDANGCVAETLPREQLWSIQTPQSFSYPQIRGAYDALMQQETIAPSEPAEAKAKVTDDAMVAELFGTTPVKLVEGSYENMKITTPEDLLLAELILSRRNRI
jgi:2-C-methyl-D-erythritol 4-phosphate cytidylyltransferase